MTPTTGHNAKVIVLLAITFIVSGFSAIHNSLTPHTAVIIDTATAILLFVEHLLNGNTANMKVSKTTSPTTGTQ